jgi:NIMA (never in mitosis gene a)-related kinase
MSIQDFKILQEIGKGTYSKVFKVRRLLDGQLYALKRVFTHKLKAREKQNSLNEIRILASIDSPYVVSYKEAFFEDDSLYVVMEYANDGDLYDKIGQMRKNRKLFPER